MSARVATGLNIFAVDPLQRGRGDIPGEVRGNVPCRVHTAPVTIGDSVVLISARVVGDGEYGGWAGSIFQVRDDYWLILDCLPAATANAPALLGLQCTVGADIESHRTQRIRVSVDGVGVNLCFSFWLDEPQCLEGSMKPRGGWISPSYG